MSNNKNNFLQKLNLPKDLRDLNESDLKQVCEELREELIDCVSSSGGHFASSLGATEISVILHHLFDTPNDKIIWDVGHQAYIHKMLTGRKDLMTSIRKIDGLSGFLKREESPFDAFGAGHAGTSISAAVGQRIALQKNNKDNYVIAVIGDGSITAGMALEALNHVGALKLNKFIVVLNDNDMSISQNVGAMSWLFSKAVTSKTSTYARSGFKSLYNKGYVPEIFYKAIDRAEEMTQGFFSTPAMLFEAFGLRYIGPVDGHNIEDLKIALENAKQQDIPVLVHCRTKKGKGYEPAEIDPIKWHGVNPFDKSKGEFNVVKVSSDKNNNDKSLTISKTYTQVFSETLSELIKKDISIVAITAAMPSGTGLDKIQEEHPSNFFDVGICEQHAVTFAAGLAAEGLKPVCAIYSTFLQRAYDQIIHDVCIQNLPVIFAIDRAGAVGNDGETHQGAFDVAYLRTIPNLVIMSPKDDAEFKEMIELALKINRPVAIRYPRGNAISITTKDYPSKYQINQYNQSNEANIGKAELIQKGKDILFVTFGPIISEVIKATNLLEKNYNIKASILNARFAKPLDSELVLNQIKEHSLICTVEDHSILGGFGSAILELVSDNNISSANIKRFGMKDIFTPHATQNEQYQLHGYDSDSMVKFIEDYLNLNRAIKQIV